MFNRKGTDGHSECTLCSTRLGTCGEVTVETGDRGVEWEGIQVSRGRCARRETGTLYGSSKKEIEEM